VPPTNAAARTPVHPKCIERATAVDRSKAIAPPQLCFMGVGSGG
jgi:hypothetical protein